jgi:hypothetical protein
MAGNASDAMLLPHAIVLPAAKLFEFPSKGAFKIEMSEIGAAPLGAQTESGRQACELLGSSTV